MLLVSMYSSPERERKREKREKGRRGGLQEIKTNHMDTATVGGTCTCTHVSQSLSADS